MATLTRTSLTQVLNEIRVVNRPGAVLWVVAIAGLASLIALLTITINDGAVPSQDRTVLDWVVDRDYPLIAGISEFVSSLTRGREAAGLSAAAIVFLWLLGMTRAALAFAFVGVVIGGVAYGADFTIGEIVGRSRPLDANPEHSFPSGHVFSSTVIFGFWGFLAVYYKFKKKLLIPLLGVLALLILAVDQLLSISPSTKSGTSTADLTRIRDDVALRESEMWFRTLAESAKDAIISADSSGDIVFWSKGAQTIFGYEQEEVLGRPLTMLVPEQYREAHRIGVQRFKATGERHVIGTTVELHGLRKDGTEFPLELSLADWKTSIGTFFSGIIRDITERKRVEEALADMASFAEMNPAPVLRLDRDGTILLVNPAARQLFGETDLLGRSWYALCPELEPIALEIALELSGQPDLALRPESDSSALERSLQGADTLWHETQIGERCLLFTYRASPERGQVYVYGADITERKRVEEALRESETMLRQSEKMAVLGTLTAGVAHELNNPAAAVKSGATQLEGAVVRFGQAGSQLGLLDLTAAQQSELQRLTHEALQRAARPQELNALARSDREGELETWLEERGMPDAWKLAPTLVNLNYDIAALTALAESFAPDQLQAVIGGLDATYTVYNLLTGIGQSAGRISEIVGALKSYSYLDQAPVQAVDLHEGLDNTLLVLSHKLKSGISVRQEYAPRLPNIQANGSELNQVWTNLIDNAADALEEQGEITIRTRHEGERGGDRNRGRRAWDSGGDSAQDIRAFLYDEAPGPGHWLGPGYQLQHRRTKTQGGP